MSRVRVVMAEVEGSDQAVADALRMFAEKVVGGAPAAAIAAPVAEAPAPLALPAAAAAPKVRRGGRRKQSAAAVTEKPAAPAETGGKTRQAILAELRKGPRTSGELIKLTGLSGPSVYTELGVMRKAMVVESRPDSDGIQKNFLKG